MLKGAIAKNVREYLFSFSDVWHSDRITQQNVLILLKIKKYFGENYTYFLLP